MKSVIADLAMENELLPRRIRRMEDEKPYLKWSRRNEPHPVGLHRALLRAGSGSQGVGPAAVDVLSAALSAGLAPHARQARPEDALHG